MRVFGDTNLFIYLLEAHPVFTPRVLRLYEAVNSGGGRLLTSALTLGELCVRPLRLGRNDLVAQYRQLVSGGAVELVSFDSVAAGEYSSLRATTPLKQPDAIQVACAITGGADVLHTNDLRLIHLGSVRGLSIRGLD